jgi:hypothetical protein
MVKRKGVYTSTGRRVGYLGNGSIVAPKLVYREGMPLFTHKKKRTDEYLI